MLLPHVRGRQRRLQSSTLSLPTFRVGRACALSINVFIGTSDTPLHTIPVGSHQWRSGLQRDRYGEVCQPHRACRSSGEGISEIVNKRGGCLAAWLGLRKPKWDEPKRHSFGFSHRQLFFFLIYNIIVIIACGSHLWTQSTMNSRPTSFKCVFTCVSRLPCVVCSIRQKGYMFTYFSPHW